MGSSTGATGRGESRSPKQSSTTTTTTKSSPPGMYAQSNVKNDGPSLRLEPSSSSNAAEATTKPLAPPPRPQPQQQQGAVNSPNYFSNPVGGSLSLEPNPFEQSFGSGAAPETPGGTKLPSVAALTSPSSLLPGTGQTPFGWGGGGLRNGPLSPAMLSGPTTDYFADTHHIRGSFPTPNESSLRTGLTPGGSGSMFPVPSPNTQAIFQLTGGAATPSTIEFQRTALAAAAKREQAQNQAGTLPLAPTSQPQDLSNGVVPLKHPEPIKPPTSSYDPHDNDAANGLFMLAQGAQGRNGVQPPVPSYASVPPAQVHAHPIQPPAPAVQPINTSPHMNGRRETRSVSEAVSAQSDESELAAHQNTRATRAKGKRGSTSTTAGTRRKAEDAPAKTPANKKSKTNGNGHRAVSAAGSYDEMDHSDDDDEDHHDNHKEGGSRSKMTDEEKRKNFLERNRVAALKCRQRKKQWLQNLQTKVEVFSNENDNLSQQIAVLREEVVNLKTLLLAHKDCPVTQQQGLHGAFSMQQQPPMEAYNPQMAPYGVMPPAMGGQPVANGGNRRFS
ncbi:transcription factor atf1 [Podospora fimiseda]|uniref:Transcription factor atf1 n=1 Tax=Podospora fimiseda TaxID=252190 RepID=A0AAN7BKD8_9PEZI|nr:transcription factor atf1 [Podospora fimiseda]